MSRDTRETALLVSFLVIVLLLKAKRGLFFCHSVETYPGKEGRKKKIKDPGELVTFALEGSGLRFTPTSILGNGG